MFNLAQVLTRLTLAILVTSSPVWASDYAVVVSKSTASDPEWNKVVKALVKKHKASEMTWNESVTEIQPELKKQMPMWVCFVARPEEAGRKFVDQVHHLTREMDEDPYPDCFWGIITGYDAKAALRIAGHEKSLVVRKVASGTEIALNECEEGIYYSELDAGLMVKKAKGQQSKTNQVPSDTTAALVQTLNDYHADLFVTSGHATERDWQIGYRYRNGQFRCENGILYGLDLEKNKHPVQSANPKVYLPIGNCLMGHVDGREAMAMAFMNSAGVNQMIGYTVPSWYGYAGWGCLDYFVEQPGRYTFTEAFFANQAALNYRLTFCEKQGGGQDSRTPLVPAKSSGLTANDCRGLLYDQNTVAFYGDPKWEARMQKGPLRWEQSLKPKGKNGWIFEVSSKAGNETFKPVNTNGSQRGGRPLIAFFPKRIGNATVIEGAEWKPVITENFVLVPNPGQWDSAKPVRIVFQVNL